MDQRAGQAVPRGPPVGRPQQVGAHGVTSVRGRRLHQRGQRRDQHRVVDVGARVRDADLHRRVGGCQPRVEVEHPGVEGRAGGDQASVTRRYSAAEPNGRRSPATGPHLLAPARVAGVLPRGVRRVRGDRDDHRSHGRRPSTTRTASSSSATSTWTCVPRVPAARPLSPNSCTIRVAVARHPRPVGRGAPERGHRHARGPRGLDGRPPGPRRSASATSRRSAEGAVWVSTMCWSSSSSSSGWPGPSGVASRWPRSTWAERLTSYPVSGSTRRISSSTPILRTHPSCPGSRRVIRSGRHDALRPTSGSGRCAPTTWRPRSAT